MDVWRRAGFFCREFEEMPLGFEKLRETKNPVSG